MQLAVNNYKSLTVADASKECSGLPVSLQLVGRRFEDEKVVAIAEYIQRELGLPFR